MITVTVLISVVVHGATAGPLAAAYAKSLTRPPAGGAAEGADLELPDVPDRRLIRRTAIRG